LLGYVRFTFVPIPIQNTRLKRSRDVRKGRRVRLTWATCAVVSIGFFGCAEAPPCKVSPVELEELREDIAVLKKDLKTAKDKEAALTADLATKQADLATKRTKPDELRAELDQVKKGAGKTEKPKDAPKDTKKTPAAATTPAPNTKPAPPAPTTPKKGTP
jgi:septal ring factor EnvC (AmiA/AmiB activator)